MTEQEVLLRYRTGDAVSFIDVRGTTQTGIVAGWGWSRDQSQREMIVETGLDEVRVPLGNIVLVKRLNRPHTADI